MAGDAGGRQEHAGVLNLAARIQQLRADDADLGPLRVLQQRVQPAGIDDLDIVVEEQQILAVRHRRRAVVEARPVERLRHGDDLVGIVAQPALPADLMGRDVVDADDLEVAVGGLVPQRRDAGFDMAMRRAGRDDDRHLAAGALEATEAERAGDGGFLHLGADAAAGGGTAQGGAGGTRAVQRFAAAPAEQFRHMTDRSRLLRAAQDDVVLGVTQQRTRGYLGPRQQIGRGEPRTADIIGRQQQIGREVGLAEQLALARGGAGADFVGIEEVAARRLRAGQRDRDEGVTAELVAGAEQAEQQRAGNGFPGDFPRGFRGAERQVELRVGGTRIDHRHAIGDRRRLLGETGAHHRGAVAVLGENRQAPVTVGLAMQRGEGATERRRIDRSVLAQHQTKDGMVVQPGERFRQQVDLDQGHPAADGPAIVVAFGLAHGDLEAALDLLAAH